MGFRFLGVFKNFLAVNGLIAVVAFDAMASTSSWKNLRLTAVVEANSSWTSSHVTTMLQRANRILAQCQISVTIESAAIPYLGTLAMDYDSLGVANEFYKQVQMPVLFLIEGRQYNGSAGWAPGSRFLFVSSYSQTEDYRLLRDPDYEILAHELGHLLGGLQHIANEQNLMAGYLTNQTTELTEAQCKSMAASSHLQEATPTN